MQEIIDKEIDEMLRMGVIEHSEAPCARMEQSAAHCDISDVITDVQAAAEDRAVRPLLPLTVLLRPFASVFCLTL